MIVLPYIFTIKSIVIFFNSTINYPPRNLNFDEIPYTRWLKQTILKYTFVNNDICIGSIIILHLLRMFDYVFFYIIGTYFIIIESKRFIYITIIK